MSLCDEDLCWCGRCEDLETDEFVIRHTTPKKRLHHFKKYKFRFIFKGNGLLSKHLTYDGDWDENSDKKSKTFPVFIKSLGEMNHCGLIYSQGKKKRWELQKRLLKETPEPEGDLSSVSVVHFSRNRTDSYKSGWLYTCTERADFRQWHAQTKIHSVSMKTSKGENIEKKGKIHRSFEFFPPNSENEPRVHVEYQVLDFAHRNRFHNVYKFRKYSSEWNLCCYPEIEGYEIKRDVVRDDEGMWQTGERERLTAIRRNTSIDENYLGLERETEDYLPRKFTLSDFMTPEPLKQIKKQRKNRRRVMSESWEFVDSGDTSERVM